MIMDITVEKSTRMRSCKHNLKHPHNDDAIDSAVPCLIVLSSTTITLLHGTGRTTDFNATFLDLNAPVVS